MVVKSSKVWDSFMAIFDSATAATKACMEIVETTMKIGDKREHEHLSLRRCRRALRDYFGEAVNLQGLIFESSVENVGLQTNPSRMNQRTRWEPLNFDFKGIPEPVNCSHVPNQWQPRGSRRKVKNKNIKFISTEPLSTSTLVTLLLSFVV